MASNYPTALDTLTNPTGADTFASGTVLHSAQHSNANDAIEAIQAELGLLPKGAYASVAARLTAITSSISGFASLISPSFTTPSLGSATATSINGTDIPSSKVLVDTTTAGTLTNKKLSDSTTYIVDVSDNTKMLQFDITGTAGITGVLRTAFTTAKTLTFPDATDTLVGLATSDILTNKTISGASNTLSNIGNSSLSNSSVIIGSTSVSLGATAATIAGLTLTTPVIGAATGLSVVLSPTTAGGKAIEAKRASSGISATITGASVTASFASVTGTISTTSTSSTMTGISSTAGLAVGMILTKTSGSGAFGGAAYIKSIDSSTQITLSTASSNTTGSITFSVAPPLNGATYTATNTFTVGQLVTITGITPSTLIPTYGTVEVVGASSSTFTIIATGLSGTWSSGGTATSYGDIQQWETSTGTVLSSMNATGGLWAGGLIDESSLNYGVHLGTLSSTPRILFVPQGVLNGTTNWQIDVDTNGIFRWYTPGVTQMTLTNASVATAKTFSVSNFFKTTSPVTKTADFTVADTETWIINNKSGSTCTATLPTASSYTGRAITISTIQAQTVVSATSNVVPIAGGAAATAILAATAGKFATLVSNGTNWVIMAAN